MPDALQATSACPGAGPGPGAPSARGRARRRAGRATWSGWKPGWTRTRPRSAPSSKRRPGARHLTAAPVTRGTGIVWCPCTLTPLPCSIRQQCAGHFAPRLLPRHILTGLGPSAHTARGEVAHASRRKRRRQRRAAAEELRRTRRGGQRRLQRRLAEQPCVQHVGALGARRQPPRLGRRGRGVDEQRGRRGAGAIGGPARLVSSSWPQ